MPYYVDTKDIIYVITYINYTLVKQLVLNKF